MFWLNIALVIISVVFISLTQNNENSLRNMYIFKMKNNIDKFVWLLFGCKHIFIMNMRTTFRKMIRLHMNFGFLLRKREQWIRLIHTKYMNMSSLLFFFFLLHSIGMCSVVIPLGLLLLQFLTQCIARKASWKCGYVCCRLEWVSSTQQPKWVYKRANWARVCETWLMW